MPENQLSHYLDEDEMIAIAEAFGGTRLYIPVTAKDDHAIVQALGRETFGKLAASFSPDTIRVPVCRELRALRYRSEGCSTGRIATRLCMTESGVERIVARAKARGLAVALPIAPDMPLDPTPETYLP